MRSEAGGRVATILGLLIGLPFAALATAQSPASAVGAAIDVVHYDVRVEPDLAARAVKGRVRVDLQTTSAGEGIELDIGALTIDAVSSEGVALEFAQSERRLRIRLAASWPRGAKRSVTIEYHGAPRFGLTFVPEKSQVYTIFSTDQWMPCVNAPSDRATLRLALVVPKELVVVANGRPGVPRGLPDGRVEHEWRLDRPSPTFAFGFAAAKFSEATSKRGKTALRYLSSEAAGSDLTRIFTDTGDMIAFFEEKSGVPYPSESYAQALVQETAGQEMSTFSLLSDEYGHAVLADPQRVGLIAHELAHQWWGIGVTCEDWTHFWLNEGFATFMASAFREKKLGREVYLKDVEGWRARYEKARSAGGDKSLAFANWNRPTADDRALVYQKGALVLHELRSLLGDAAFWKGLRDYTKENFGRSVVTSTFKAAMEHSSKRDLSDFFDLWVYAKTPRSN